MRESEKIALDELHKRKIDLADEVLVLNVGGYIGDSTKSEVTYAIENGKPVRWLEPETTWHPDVLQNKQSPKNLKFMTTKKPTPLEWENPNKAKIETGHKAFDKFCNCLGTGNIYSDGQVGVCIRPKSETECNGRTFPEGALRDFDLKPFRSLGLPHNVALQVLAATETEPANLSALFHYKGDRITMHGYVLTKNTEGNHKLLWKTATGPTKKSRDVVDWCAKRIST